MDFNFEEKEINLDFLSSPNFDEAFKKIEIDIFLIDVVAFEFVNAHISESNFSIVKSCYLSMLKNKIKTSPNDKTGLIFYNTLVNSNKIGIQGVFVFQDINPTNFSRICDVEHLHEDFVENIGSSLREVSLLDSLKVCQSYLETEEQENNTNKKIFIFTANDSPIDSIENDSILLFVKVK